MRTVQQSRLLQCNALSPPLECVPHGARSRPRVLRRTLGDSFSRSTRFLQGQPLSLHHALPLTPLSSRTHTRSNGPLSQTMITGVV